MYEAPGIMELPIVLVVDDTPENVTIISQVPKTNAG
jgi:hypothetical protein